MKALVSILLPVYNAEAYIMASVNSLLAQSWTNLQIIVVDDGSTDNTAKLLQGISDPRVLLLRQQNAGVASALNKALEHATGKYIARQDADDISLPNRFEKLVNYLESNPATGLVGSAARIIDKDGVPQGYLKHPLLNDKLQYGLLWDSVFVSSSTLFRSECLPQERKFYTGTSYFEDYHMWSDIASEAEVANLPDILVHYRQLHTGLSHTTKNSNERIINQRLKNLSNAFPELSSEICEALSYSGFKRSQIRKLSDLHVIYKAFEKKFSALSKNGELDAEIKSNLRARLHTFAFYTGEGKKTPHPFGRLLEKIVYPIYLR